MPDKEKKQITDYIKSEHQRGPQVLNEEIRRWIIEQRAKYRDKIEVLQELEDKFDVRITVMAFNRYWNLKCSEKLVQYHDELRQKWLKNLDEEYLAQTRNQIRELTKMYNEVMGSAQYEFELEDVKLFQRDGKTPLTMPDGKPMKGKALIVKVDNAGKKRMESYRMCMDILDQIANLAHLYKIDIRMTHTIKLEKKDKQDLNSIDDLDFAEYEDITEILKEDNTK